VGLFVKRGLSLCGISMFSLVVSCQTAGVFPSVSNLSARGRSEAPEQPVILDVAGRLERNESSTLDFPSLDFRTRVQIDDKGTLSLVGLDHRSFVQGKDVTNTEKDPLDLGGDDRLVIELKPVSFGPDSVTLDFQVLKVNTKTGAKTLLSGPIITTEYGTLAEIREVNTSPDAPISRLSLSVLPQKVLDSSGADADSMGQ
jgi:hypothetical protein